MNVIWEYFKDTVLYVLGTLLHNAPALILGITVAAVMQVFVNTEKLKSWLMRRSSVSIPATVVFGAFTPFCACGTMAVVISMLATALPWGPVMAFLTSSPLMSPEGFVLISGIISPTFAIALATASVIIGVGSGYVSNMIQRKTRFLDDQLRFVSGKSAAASEGCGCAAANSADALTANTAACSNAETERSSCGCSASDPQQALAANAACCDAETAQSSCGCSASDPPQTLAANAACCNVVIEQSSCGCAGAADVVVQDCCGAISNKPHENRSIRGAFAKYKIDKVLKAVFDVGIKKILPYFVMFAAIGYLINRLIPSAWITTLFGSDSIFAVPLAAVVGLPLYVNGDSSIPLIQSLLQSGVGPGAMLAFLITGPGTSAGVMAGIATIMKKRALGLYVAFLLAGAIVLGYAYELILMLIK